MSAEPVGWHNIPADVLRELIDPEYENRTHHKRATYALGCHGPLCRKAEREEGERRRRRAAEAKGKPYKMYTRTAGDIHRDEYLNEILAWHMTVRSTPKLINEALEAARDRVA